MNSPNPSSSATRRAKVSAFVYGCERGRKSDTTQAGARLGKRVLQIAAFAAILGAVAFVGGVPTLVGFVLGAAMTVRHTLSRT
jgi:predicted ABC-type sugar transport system permease subunit